MYQIIRKPKREEFDMLGAKIIAASIERMLSYQENVVLAIPGGRSVSGIFKNLKTQNIIWNRVHLFMVDERLVPLHHKDSNYRQAEEVFLKEMTESGRIPKENIHPFRLDLNAEDFGLEVYAHELRSVGGRYDIILLSSGEDGHIGALYPKHHSIEEDDPYFIAMGDSPKPPQERMTASRILLSGAKISLTLFLSESKRAALQNFMDEKMDMYNCPVKLVMNLPMSYILTDLR